MVAPTVHSRIEAAAMVARRVRGGVDGLSSLPYSPPSSGRKSGCVGLKYAAMSS
jgi:hypothetical protein